MKGLPPLQWLRSFEAAARHLSFTAAAAELHLTQSAISQQVKLLENYLGQPLFVRRARGLQLTEPALYFLSTVQDAFKTLHRGSEMFRGKDADNVLEIKANWAFTVFWLSPRIAGFLSRYPWIQLNLSAALWESDYANVGASIEIRFGTGTWDDVGGDEQLTADRCYPVASRTIAERLESLESLANGPMIHTVGARDDWKTWLNAAGYKGTPSPVNEHHGTSFIITFSLAEQGLGAVLAHNTLCRDLVDDGRLVRLFDHDLPMKENYYLIAGRKTKTNQASRVFREWLLEQMR